MPLDREAKNALVRRQNAEAATQAAAERAERIKTDPEYAARCVREDVRNFRKEIERIERRMKARLLHVSSLTADIARERGKLATLKQNEPGRTLRHDNVQAGIDELTERRGQTVASITLDETVIADLRERLAAYE